jgi:hypothetical protein
VPLAPTFTDDVCVGGSPAGSSYSVPSKTGVSYQVNGIAAAAGTYPGTDGSTITVTAAAQPGYALSGTTSWTHIFTVTPDCAGVTSPSIHAHLSSAHPKSAAGWYRSAVRLTFSCTVGSAPLVVGCPVPVILKKSTAGQTVTRTIHASDGGVATVTVSHIKIDRVVPTVHVTGVTGGHTYSWPGPKKIGCKAHDHLSGLAAHCKVSEAIRGHKVKVTATAVDRAGNVSTARKTYRINP